MVALPRVGSLHHRDQRLELSTACASSSSTAATRNPVGVYTRKRLDGAVAGPTKVEPFKSPVRVQRQVA